MTALLTDLYQLTMLQAYLEEGMSAPAVFELFVRKLPPQRNFLVAAGLEPVLQFLETLSFSEAEIDWLREQDGFSPQLLEQLGGLRFEGDVDAMPEGTVFFADEPFIRITAALPQAQLVESRLLNLAHFATLIASKAARIALVAGGKRLIDFGMRRAHGAEAALLAARSAYLAGFDGTATAEAGRRYGIPVSGTMAHSFVQAHSSERAALEAFARARPHGPTLLIDTYDTEAAAAKVIELVPLLRRDGIAVAGVRIDSGDLAAHARAVRALLDAAGLRDIGIFASGDLDEHRVAALVADAAPIDGFGVGTALDTSSDHPALDAVYKLQSYDGQPRRKRSEGKATWPGVKQVVRLLGSNGRIERDIVQLDSEACGGEALLLPCMRGGRRVGAAPTLRESRDHHARQMKLLPDALRGLQAAPACVAVDISSQVRALALQVDAAVH